MNLWLDKLTSRSSTPGITVGVGFLVTGSTGPPFERSNRIRPRRDRLTTATISRSIQLLQMRHQSSLPWFLSDWSLSPHFGQVLLVPIVSRLDKRITGRPIHLALYSNCCWTSLNDQVFIVALYLLPCQLPLR